MNFLILRRQVIGQLLVGWGTCVSVLRAQTSARTPTPQDALGPYYPPQWSGEIDNDLVHFNGKDYAHGVLMLQSGRVLSSDGSVIANAQIDIWQTDATGKYRHPGDDGEGPAQRGFQGYGRTRSDTQGHYAFRTIQPVIYGGRPPHLHLKVTAAGHRELVTQMYFAGQNTESNRFFNGFSKERDTLTITPSKIQTPIAGRASIAARFDVVLAKT